MKLKLVFYLSLFTLLTISNFYLIFSLQSLNDKDALVRRVIDEISQPQNQRKQSPQSGAPFVLGAYEPDIEVTDGRVANLKSFFRRYNSALYDQADLIVKVSDQYGFDYRLLPAIAMQESNLCKYIPAGSHNCWGWGIYGDLVTRFPSYDEAIHTVAEGIKKEYIDKGLVGLTAIMRKYTPPSTGSWAKGVGHFFQALE